MLRHLLLPLLLVFFVASCAPDESLPPARNSFGATNDGSHSVPISGAPDVFKFTHAIDSTAAPEGFSTAPVALFAPRGFAIASRNGRIFVFNDQDSLANTIDLASHEMIEQIMADQWGIYAISVSGDVFAVTPDGKQLWKSSVNGTLTGAAILAPGLLVIPRGDMLFAIDAKTGSVRWQRPCPAHVISVAHNDKENYLVAALSNYEAGQTDSLAIMDLAGKMRTAIALTGARVTSNVAICGEDKNALAVGVLTLDAAGRKPSAVWVYEGVTSSQPKLRWKHTLPYLVMNVASNNDQVFTSGFRTVENELVSGINAFTLNDTISMWSRRFTEPVGSPIAVSKGNVYFTLSFTSEAIVESRALFYALRAGSGKTETERAFKGVNAFVPGMPIPDEQGRFLIADRDHLVVHILDRSSLKRVF